MKDLILTMKQAVEVFGKPKATFYRALNRHPAVCQAVRRGRYRLGDVAKLAKVHTEGETAEAIAAAKGGAR